MAVDPDEKSTNQHSVSTTNTVLLLTLPGAALCSIPFGLFIQVKYLPWQLVSPLTAMFGAMILIPVSAISSWIALRTQTAAPDGDTISRWFLAFNLFVFIATASVLFLTLMLIIFRP